MKLKYISSLLLCLIAQCINAQQSLDDLLKRYNKNNVPYISVQELAMPKTNTLILDAREAFEFEVSHIKDALFVGYNHFQLNTITRQIPNKDQAIVVYCSLGIRSEVIANKLKKVGYKNVKNLYGGIFEWKNNDFDIYNSQAKTTDSIHTFSKIWSKWSLKGIKVFSEDMTIKND